jgi:hypothetical protein
MYDPLSKEKEGDILLGGFWLTDGATSYFKRKDDISCLSLQSLGSEIGR